MSVYGGPDLAEAGLESIGLRNPKQDRGYYIVRAQGIGFRVWGLGV